MSEPLVLLRRDEDGVAVLTFHDPKRRNAMTQDMGEAFSQQVAELAADTNVRAVVLTGGGRAFSAGGDIGMIQRRADEGALGTPAAREAIRLGMRGFYELFLSVRELPCPTFAAINGHAIGAGLCVALACDVRLVAREAKLALNFTKLGLHPGMGATWTLPRLVGPAIAAELLYTGRMFGGDEAARMGLVNRVLPASMVLGATLDLARQAAAAAPAAVRGVKRALRLSPSTSLEEQLDFEATEQADCFAAADIREGLAAAREKRAPKFEDH